MMSRQVISLTCLCFTALLTGLAEGQLRIANYNIIASGGTLNPGFSTVFQGIANDNTSGFARPIDILLVQETQAQATTTQAVVNILNTLYGANTYAHGVVDADTTGGGRTGIIYRTASVSLVGETQVGTASTDGAPRAPMRYQFRPVGYGTNSDFYIYNSHYKASSGGSNATRRGIEADMIRANADPLGASARIIYGGDFNTYSSSEVMLTGNGTITGLTSAGNGQASDPLNRPGTWDNDADFVDIHTQSPLETTPNGSGLVGGGISSRFDMQYLTNDLLNGEGVAYIPGSYHAFMNNGSVPLGKSINVASNDALPSLPNHSTVLNALTTASDHLPLVVDYQIPAKMSVGVTAPPTQVIVGATAVATISVSNTAPVAVAIGADELDYTYSGSGRLSGSGNGMDQALGGANVHTLSLNTATAGLATGTISVSSSSESAASANFSQTLNVSVLSHANPSLSGSGDVNSATVDFGIVANGAGSLSQGFNVANLVQTVGYTAGLKLTSISGAGDTAALTTNAATFSNLAAGGSMNFNASLSKSAGYGTFTAVYTLLTADQDLPGATALENLSLTLTGILALAGDANIDGFVDTSDFNAVAGNFGQTGGWVQGDFDGNGTIDSTDFTLLTSTFGQRVTMSAPALGAVVPEPAMLGLLPVIYFLQRRRLR